MRPSLRLTRRGCTLLAVAVLVAGTASAALASHESGGSIGAKHAPPVNPADPDRGVTGDADSPSYMMMRNAYLQDRFGAPPGLAGNPRQAAIEHARRRSALQPLAPTIGQQWAPLGPQPIVNGSTYDVDVATSGRVSAIAVHPTQPNTVFVGGAQGGVWRSTDGGGTWTPIFDSADSLAIGSLAIAPSSPTTLYVGTGESAISCDSFGGVGIYRIDNATTSPVIRGPINPGGMFTKLAISKILVSPTNAAHIWVTSTLGRVGNGCQRIETGMGLFRSLNATSATGSVTFETLPLTLSSGEWPSDMVLFGTGTLLVGVRGTSSGNGGVWRTTNRDASLASLSFTKTASLSGRVELDAGGTTSPPTVIAVSESFSGRVSKSTDGGATFTTLSSSSSTGWCGGQCWYDMAVGVSPTDGNDILVGGAAGSDGPGNPSSMIRSTDGSTFALAQSTLHADTHAVEFAPSNSSVVYVGNDGGIWRSSDGGATWVTKNNGLSFTQFQSIATHVSSSGIMIGGTQDNGTLNRIGSSWYTSSGGDGGYAAIDQSSTSATTVSMYHTYYFDYDHILYARYVGAPNSADPEDWELIGCYRDTKTSPPTPHNGIGCDDASIFYAPLELGPGTPNTVYLGTNRLYRSSDKGTNHTVVSQIFPEPASAIAIAPTSDAVRMVGLRNGRLYQTRTGSSSLTEITGPWYEAGVSEPFIAAMTYDPLSSNRAYVTLSRYFGDASPHVYRSVNMNAATPTWEAISDGIPDVPVNAIAIDPANRERLYIGTDIGVYRSEDFGSQWYPWTDGMPTVAVFDLAISQRDTATAKLRAATHGRGIYEILIGDTYPRVTISPQTIGFGKRVVGGQSQAEAFTITNSGTDTLQMGTLTTSAHPAFPIVSNACTNATLGPGQTCAISVRFQPTVEGNVSGALMIGSQTISSPDAMYFHGIGTAEPAPAVSLSATSLPFPNVAVGSESATQNVTLTNTGDATLSLGSPVIGGTGGSSFRLVSTDCKWRELAPGGVCTLSVRFVPASTGAKAAILTITSDAADSPHFVALNGTGLTTPVPQLSLSQTSIAFGDRQINTAAAVQSLTVTNTGTASFAMSQIAVSGGASFSKGADTCTGATLTPSTLCTVEIRFAPTTIGAKSGNVSLTSTAPGSPHVVGLSGTGVAQPAPAFRAFPSRIDYPDTTVGGLGEMRSTTIANDGNANLVIGAVSITGLDGSHFQKGLDGCVNQTLAPAATCTVNVRFLPSSTGGKAASLQFSTNTGSSASVFLAGSGINQGTPALTLSHSELIFFSSTVGVPSTDRAVVVSSTGTVPLTLGTAAISGVNPSDFSIVADGCSGQSLAPSSQCTVLLRFTPSVTGTRSASVAIPSNASTGIVGLYGTGAAPGAPQSGISSPSNVFGSQIVGTAGPYRSILVSNSGTAALVVAGAVLEGVNPGDYSMLDYCAGKSVPPGGTCPVYLAFKPLVAGTRAASLRVTSNAATVTSALTGTGTTAPVPQPGVIVTPASSALGYSRIDRPGGTATITVTSSGQSPLYVSSVSLAGASYDQFRVTQDTCSGGTFSNGRTCAVTVLFAPDRTGSLSAGLTVTTNAGGPVATLTGIGDNVAPTSQFVMQGGPAIVTAGAPLAGSTVDDHNVASVLVSFVNALGATQKVAAQVTCATASSCTWTARPPALPGLYTAVAHATDVAGNVEAVGPEITVFAV